LFGNVDKSKLLMVCPSQRTNQTVGSHLKVNGKKFEVISKFPYLGALVDDKFRTGKEIRRGIVTAQQSVFGLDHFLRAKSISRKTKLTLSEAMIAPDDCRGKTKKRRPVPYEGKQRAISDLSRSRYSRSGPTWTTSMGRHVVRREENHPLKKVFEGEFRDGNRKRGGAKNSLKDFVSRDSAAFGLTNWQRTSKFLSFVSITNFVIPSNLGHKIFHNYVL
jgi:hypothetical protein